MYMRKKYTLIVKNYYHNKINDINFKQLFLTISQKIEINKLKHNSKSLIIDTTL